MTTELNKRLHSLLNKTNLTPLKPDLVCSFTDDRTTHSSEMNDEEATELCNYLQDELNKGTGENEGVRMNRMRRSVISMAYEMGWASAGDWKTALDKINLFSIGKHGKFKKALQDHSYQELVQVVTQFRQLYKKHLKAI